MENQTDVRAPLAEPLGLIPQDFYDPVIEAYKKDVDRTLLRENLKLTVAERCRKFERNMQMVYELRRAGRHLRDRAKAEP